MKIVNFTISLFLVFILIMSCQSESKKNQDTSNPTENTNTPTASEENTSKKTVTPLATKDLVYAWVDKLNIRDKADLKAKAITSANSNDALEFTGEKSKEIETIVLRGVAYEEPWLKIITPDKKEGWVFGGAVKKKDEEKGNDEITDTKFSFPHFGTFDLSEWKKKATKTEGEEVDYVISSYQKGNRILKISSADMGEMYYGYDYILFDDNKKKLKSRSFNFTGDGKMLNEVVKDFTSNMEYSRSQTLKKHWYQLNAKPVMVNGVWSKKNMGTTSSNNSPVNIKPINFADCKMPDKDSGCSCDFRLGESNQSEGIFMTNYGKNACITLSNGTQALIGDFVKNGFDDLWTNSQSEHWLVLNEKGKSLLFGKEFKIGDDYDGERNKIYQTLLIMPQLPKSIPYKTNGTVGMGFRGEVRDMCNEALDMAKKARAKDDYGIPTRMMYANDQYEVRVTARVVGIDDGGGKQYQGTLEVTDKKGNIIATKKVWGGCGC